STDLAEDRIKCIHSHAAFLGLQLLRQIDNRNGCIISSAKEEGDGETFNACWRRDDAVHIRSHKSIRGKFKQFAGIDDKGTGNRRRIDPLAVFALNPQTWNHILQENGHEATILVGSHALFAFRYIATRITNNLQELGGMRFINLGEKV